MNTAIEDYLKLIYELENDGNDHYVKNATLVDHLGYTVQSVNEMIKKMDRMKLVTYKPYLGVQLTKKGRDEALRMIRAHRIWEVFLSNKLGLSWEALHDEAEKLEHATSSEVLDRLYAFLGRPKYCNHGNPIPDENGQIAPTYKKSLFSVNKGETFDIKRVMDYKPLLNHLNKLNLSLNDRLTIIEKDSFSKTIQVLKNDEVISVSQNVAEMIFGKTLK